MKQYVLMFLAFSLVACKGGGGGGGGGSASYTITPGSYQTCENDTSDNTSRRIEVIADLDIITQVDTFYSVLNCTPGNEMFNNRFIWGYDKTATNKYRLSLGVVNSTSLTVADVNWNNANSYCGHANWVLNEPKDITGDNCEGEVLNTGDYKDITIKKSGTSLIVTDSAGTQTYTYNGGWNFTNQGQSLADGSYAFFNGGVGIYLTLAGGNYTFTYYDPDTSRYFTEAGTYTSSNNSTDFTVVSYTPDCGTDEGTTTAYPFSRSSNSLALKAGSDTYLLMEKVSFTNNQFHTAYLGGGYAAACF